MLFKGAVVHNKGEKFKIEELELDPPKQNEVIVKIVGVGVCHTDAVVIDQLIPVPLPAVLGHEGSGIVMETGSGVSSVQPGDRVVLSFSSCGYCENCLSGRPYVCLNFNPINFGGVMSDGTKRIRMGGKELSSFFGQSSFAEYAIVNERNLVKIEDKDVDIALLGPLGCGFQTGAGTVLNRLNPEFGTSIAVFGCGSVGLSAVMGAKIAGCEKIIAVDINQQRLELAKELGATHIINGKEVASTVDEIKSITNGGVNYAVETTAVPAIVNQSLYSLKVLGTVAIVGATGDVTINVQTALMGEGKSMIGVIEGDSVPQIFIPKLVKYYKEGKFPIDKLIKFYKLEEINEAFEDSHNGITIKPIIKME